MVLRGLTVLISMFVVGVGVAEAAPRAVASPLAYASREGAALNSDLMRGGGTDDTLSLQRVLDRAKDGRGVHLVIDGPALVSGLDLYSNTIIECAAGGGLYLKDKANRAILRNKHRSSNAVTDRHIAVQNCFLNGNSEGQAIVGPKDSVFRFAQEADGTFMSGLQFFGLDYLDLKGLTLWNIRSFGAAIGNARHIEIRNVTVDIGAPPYPDGQGLAAAQDWIQRYARSSDGLHFFGPLQYLNIDGAMFRITDDGISLTADDLPHAKAGGMGPYIAYGPITDVLVSNIIFMGASHAVRLTSATSRVDRIVMSNIAGTVRDRMMVISPFLFRGNGNFGSIIANNIAVDLLDTYPRSQLYALANRNLAPEAEVDLKTWMKPGFDSGEEDDHPLFSLNGRIENLQLRNVVTQGVAQRPLIRVGRDALINSLTVDLSVHDPKLLAIPMKVMGRVENLDLMLNWGGDQAISYDGGSIGKIRNTAKK